MKKVYTKPQIAFESFQLTSNIAGDCNTKPNTQADDATCGYNDNGWIIFQSSTVCVGVQVGQDGIYDKICYHVPTGDISVFTS